MPEYKKLGDSEESELMKRWLAIDLCLWVKHYALGSYLVALGDSDILLAITI